jgi:AraC family transcriptional regulator
MIRVKHGVAITHQDSWSDFGIEEIAMEVRWLTEPGWLMLEVEAPTLYMMAMETGGRCEFRATPDRPVEGDYFGSGALTLAAPGSQVAVYAAEMRDARLCCFALHATEAEYLTSQDTAALGLLQSRYMFKDERAGTCAALLDGGHRRDDSAPYIHSLSKALFAAVLEMENGANRPSKAVALTGPSWDAISRHIRDNLGETVAAESLAEIAQLPPERFGAAFRHATGMSVRQWQMDCRVRSAQRLLADNSDESLAEVATLCGFADQSHFTRAFLKVVGLTPTAWLHSRA